MRGLPAGDYLDGFLARATGQYSRMGALLDPVVDRLTVLAGAAVCWHFELLPRWALLVLAGREVAMLILGRLALRRGFDDPLSAPVVELKEAAAMEIRLLTSDPEFQKKFLDRQPGAGCQWLGRSDGPRG